MNTGEIMCYFIKTPKHYKYSTTQQKTNNWLVKNFHHINWTFGQTSFNYLRKNVLDSLVRSSTVLYAKGIEKCKYLEKVTQKPVLNIEELNCPRFAELNTPSICCGLDKHQNNPHCALKKVVAYAGWYHEQSDKKQS